jgi:hypothetical protein
MTTLYSNKPRKPLTEKKLDKVYTEYFSEVEKPVAEREPNHYYNVVLKALQNKYEDDLYDGVDEPHTIASSIEEKIDITSVAKKAKAKKVKSDEIKDELFKSYHIATIEKIMDLKKLLDNRNYALCKRNNVHGYIITTTRYEPDMTVVFYREVKENTYEVYKFPFSAVETSSQTYNNFTFTWNNDFIWKEINSRIQN